MLGIGTPIKSESPSGLCHSKLCYYYLMGKAVKEILLCHHFIPVPVHLLPKVGIFTLLQLDESCDLFHQKERLSGIASHPVAPEHTLNLFSLVSDRAAMIPLFRTCQHDGEG